MLRMLARRSFFPSRLPFPSCFPPPGRLSWSLAPAPLLFHRSFPPTFIAPPVLVPKYPAPVLLVVLDTMRMERKEKKERKQGGRVGAKQQEGARSRNDDRHRQTCLPFPDVLMPPFNFTLHEPFFSLLHDRPSKYLLYFCLFRFLYPCFPQHSPSFFHSVALTCHSPS